MKCARGPSFGSFAWSAHSTVAEQFRRPMVATLRTTALLSGALLTAITHAAAQEPTFDAWMNLDAYGVPHIVARDDRGLGYGQGYAYGSQNLCLLADQIVTTRGERTAAFGPEGQAVVAFRPVNNVSSDLYHQAFFPDAAIDRAVDRAGPRTRDLLEGFVRGYNRALREASIRAANPSCDGADWVRPINVRDLARSYMAVNAWLSVGAFAESFSTGALPQDTGTPGAIGSNAYAFGKAVAEGGGGIVVANPHTPWLSTLRLWQSRLTIVGEVDSIGAGFGGWPVHMLGFNDHMSWATTVSPAARMVVLRLEAQQQSNGTIRYTLDGAANIGELLDIGVVIDGQRITHKAWKTRFGLAMQLGGENGAFYAIADAFAENLDGLEAWSELSRQTTVEGADGAMVARPGLSVSILAADSRGQAYYGDLSPVPDISRDMVAQCTLPQDPGTHIGQMLVLDGTRSACTNHLPDGRVRNAPPSALPRLFSDRFTLNSNNSYRHVVDEPIDRPLAPLLALPAEQDSANLRTIMSFQRVAEELDRDGSISLKDAQQIVMDNRNFAAERLLPALQKVCAAEPSPSAECEALADWNGRVDADGRAVLLFSQIWHSLGPDASELAMGGAMDDEGQIRLRSALTTAVQDLAALNLAASTPWGSILSRRLTNGDTIPLHGGAADQGVLNTLEGLELTSEGYATIIAGASYLHAVRFGPAGLTEAETLMTHGQSSEPSSPHYADQTRLYSRKQWIIRQLDPVVPHNFKRISE